jgi:hypothetical protein
LTYTFPLLSIKRLGSIGKSLKIEKGFPSDTLHLSISASIENVNTEKRKPGMFTQGVEEKREARV